MSTPDIINGIDVSNIDWSAPYIDIEDELVRLHEEKCGPDSEGDFIDTPALTWAEQTAARFVQ